MESMSSDIPPTEPQRPEWVGKLRQRWWRENLGPGKHRTWMGVSIRKPAEDLQRYQEIIFETRPQGILETGGAYGGSALFFCHMLDLIEAPLHHVVVSVSKEWYGSAKEVRHHRLHLWDGGSLDAGVVRMAHEMFGNQRVMVSLDSDHSTSHVMDELDAYHDLVGKDMYLVVEDTTVEDVPSHSRTYHQCGPREALARWLPKHPEFVQEEGPKYLTCNHFGWLRRTS